MRVSVIIPVYNAENTIIETLGSVLKQTVLPYEIILVNDGSNDNSRKLIENFLLTPQSVPIRLINKENGGVSSARNIGIEASRGDWVALLDADDEWLPDKIKIIQRYLREDVYLVAHDFLLPNEKTIPCKDSKARIISKNQLLFRNMFVTPSVCFKNSKEFFFDENMRYAEDHDLWLRISATKKIIFLECPLVRLGRPVLSEGGASGSKWRMRKGEMKMYKKFFTENKGLSFLYPFFISFSLLKHLKQKF